MDAAFSQNTDAVFTLIEEKVNVNAENRCGYTALHHAVYNGPDEILLALLRAGCVTNMPHWSETPLRLAARNMGDISFEILLVFGANPFELFRKDETLLHVAFRRCRIELVDFALRAGVCVNARNSDGQTALMLATSWNYIDAVRPIVQHKASLNAEDNDCQTALVHGISSGSTECAVYLMIEGSTRCPKW